MKVITRQVSPTGTVTAAPVTVLTPPTENTVVAPETGTNTGALTVVEKAPITNYHASGQIVGEISRSDIQMPRLQIAQGNGELTKIHPQGTILYMDEVLLKSGETTKFNFIPFQLTKRYRERLPKGSTQLPRSANTEAEVRNMGGTTRWIGDEPPNWSETAIVSFLLEKPDNVNHTGFVYEVNGKHYGPAIFFAGNTSYRYVGKPIITASTQVLFDNGQQKLHKYVWTMQFQLVKSGSYEVYTPVISRTSNLTPDSVSELIARVSGTAANAEFEE
jgi:hypothetical protein